LLEVVLVVVHGTRLFTQVVVVGQAELYITQVKFSHQACILLLSVTEELLLLGLETVEVIHL
jgi:hypothetical protein